MQLTEGFRREVELHWGNPKKVANVGLSEILEHGDEISLDYDDQIRYALRIGVLAGETKDQGSSVFIERFEKEILNEE
ncbi:MAG: hypothetical protein WC242_03625 [Candidatus Paceibacterota bacterium]|jgi:hypothetical protein